MTNQTTTRPSSFSKWLFYNFVVQNLPKASIVELYKSEQSNNQTVHAIAHNWVEENCPEELLEGHKENCNVL